MGGGSYLWLFAGLPFLRFLEDEAGGPILQVVILGNVILVGALAATGVLPLERKHFEAAISKRMKPDQLALNLSAFDTGASLIWIEKRKPCTSGCGQVALFRFLFAQHFEYKAVKTVFFRGVLPWKSFGDGGQRFPFLRILCHADQIREKLGALQPLFGIPSGNKSNAGSEFTSQHGCACYFGASSFLGDPEQLNIRTDVRYISGLKDTSGRPCEWVLS
jgi:hypothetical protein